MLTLEAVIYHRKLFVFSALLYTQGILDGVGDSGLHAEDKESKFLERMRLLCVCS